MTQGGHEPNRNRQNRTGTNRHEPTRTANRLEPNRHEPPNRQNRTDANRPDFHFSENGVVTKTFAPKFCAEWSDREVHSSHGDYFRDHFCFFCFGTQKLTPIPKNVVVTKTFAPKFCAEWSDREVHSSHGDSFHDHFCVYVSGLTN